MSRLTLPDLMYIYTVRMVVMASQLAYYTSLLATIMQRFSSIRLNTIFFMMR
jgi:hypothetical protein